MAAIADDIAYNSHDLDDGLRAGLIALDDLRRRSAGRAASCEQAPRGIDDSQRVIYEVNRRIITDHDRRRGAANPRRGWRQLREQSLEGVRAAAGR